MKVAALGDAHLGRSYLPFTTAEGVNQRERDFEVSFEAAVDLALAQQPDLIVWLGDVFDHPRPTYRSFRLAQRMPVRIRDHRVPPRSSPATPTSTRSRSTPACCAATLCSSATTTSTPRWERASGMPAPPTPSPSPTLPTRPRASSSSTPTRVCAPTCPSPASAP